MTCPEVIIHVHSNVYCRNISIRVYGRPLTRSEIARAAIVRGAVIISGGFRGGKGGANAPPFGG